MRIFVALFLIPLLAVSGVAEAGRQNRMPQCMSNEKWEQLAQRLKAHPPYLSAFRLPEGMRIGRCLMTVSGKNIISGPCAYSMESDGSFIINGPRQIYGGIDYPDCFTGAATFTTDYFAYVEWNDRMEMFDGSKGPGWEAHWNKTIGSNHADAYLRPVKRAGACYSNAETKICLWKR